MMNAYRDTFNATVTGKSKAVSAPDKPCDDVGFGENREYDNLPAISYTTRQEKVARDYMKCKSLVQYKPKSSKSLRLFHLTPHNMQSLEMFAEHRSRPSGSAGAATLG